MSGLHQGLVVLMNGDIQVVSQEGKGSTFTVMLPRRMDNENGAEVDR